MKKFNYCVFMSNFKAILEMRAINYANAKGSPAFASRNSFKLYAPFTQCIFTLVNCKTYKYCY